MTTTADELKDIPTMTGYLEPPKPFLRKVAEAVGLADHVPTRAEKLAKRTDELRLALKANERPLMELSQQSGLTQGVFMRLEQRIDVELDELVAASGWILQTGMVLEVETLDYRYDPAAGNINKPPPQTVEAEASGLEPDPLPLTGPWPERTELPPSLSPIPDKHEARAIIEALWNCTDAVTISAVRAALLQTIEWKASALNPAYPSDRLTKLVEVMLANGVLVIHRDDEKTTGIRYKAAREGLEWVLRFG